MHSSPASLQHTVITQIKYRLVFVNETHSYIYSDNNKTQGYNYYIMKTTFDIDKSMNNIINYYDQNMSGSIVLIFSAIILSYFSDKD